MYDRLSTTITIPCVLNIMGTTQEGNNNFVMSAEFRSREHRGHDEDNSWNDLYEKFDDEWRISYNVTCMEIYRKLFKV